MAETYVDNHHQREIIATREVLLSDQQRFTTLSAVGGIINALEAQPDRITGHDTVISNIPLHSGWLPFNVQAQLRGMDFGRLDISIAGRNPKHQAVELTCFSRRPEEPNRTVTFMENDDETYLDVIDSHDTRARTRGMELAQQVRRADVTYWLARQALKDATEARDFVHSHHDHALSAAAGLLLMRAEAKMIAVSTGKPVKIDTSPARAQTYTVRGYTIDDAFNYPQYQLNSAWLVDKYEAHDERLEDVPIVRRTLVEYSPTDDVLPHSTHSDTESIRIELSTTADVDPAVLGFETDMLAQRFAPKLVSMFRKARAEVSK